jgi:hypothetical protein
MPLAIAAEVGPVVAGDAAPIETYHLFERETAGMHGPAFDLMRRAFWDSP